MIQLSVVKPGKTKVITTANRNSETSETVTTNDCFFIIGYFRMCFVSTLDIKNNTRKIPKLLLGFPLGKLLAINDIFCFLYFVASCWMEGVM